MTRLINYSALLCAAVMMLSTAAAAQTANSFYLSIEGVKQGKLKGECTLAAHQDQIAGLDFNYAVTKPATGKRQHSPVTITKAWGAASPQLFQAAVTNEVLKNIMIEFYEPGDKNTEVMYYLIRLTNATVSDIHQHIVPEKGMVEDVSFTFQRIDVESKTGKTMATDDATK
jgi:type VI secretion system Hcp family effector